MRGTIDRRLLVNFAVDPGVLERLLPPPFRPKVVRGHGIAGICLIRLTHMRPSGFPAAVGVTSENAAHRIAVHWDEGGAEREGVFIPRRDTSSRINTLLGGRLFPGVHHRASFDVAESQTHLRVGFQAKHGGAGALVSGRMAEVLPQSSIFSSLEEVSNFFERGSVGYSVSEDPNEFDGLELRTRRWRVQPIDVDEVHSSFFDDRSLFPPGTARFDNALVMKDIEHDWHALKPLRSKILDASLTRP